MSNDLAVIESDVFGCEANFNRVLSDRSINFHREAEFAIQVISGNSFAMKLAVANRQSVVNAVTNLAAIGLSLNPAKKQAYLVPRDGKICLDISYVGLVELAVASGSVMWVKAELVREADKFTLNGMGSLPTHTFDPFSKNRGALVGVYCVAKTASGDYLTDTMAIDDVYDIRDRSSAWKAWISKQSKCPWVTDEGEMIKKGLALDTPIPTPNGWTTMGDINVGDVVFDMDGQQVSVKDKSEIKNIRCFKLTMSNGDEITCDDEHRWVARIGGSHANRKSYDVLTINEMHDAKARGLAVTVPTQGELNTDEIDLPIDPYLLGYWLGDGSSRGAQITVGAKDLDHFVEMVGKTSYAAGKISKDKRANVYCVGVVGGFRNALLSSGLIGNKHVPDIYLRAGKEARRMLLAGLLDSDGHISKTLGRAMFNNKNKTLSDAVCQLAVSLGEAPSVAVQTQVGFGVKSITNIVVWKPHFCPCINPRKAANYAGRKIASYRAISSIVEVPSVPTRCISVTGVTETFLAGKSMVPTHNTIVKRASKMWPKTDRLDEAIHHLNIDSGEGLADLATQKPEVVQDISRLPDPPDGWIEKRWDGWVQTIMSGERTTEELIEVLCTRYSLSEGLVDKIRKIPETNAGAAE